MVGGRDLEDSNGVDADAAEALKDILPHVACRGGGWVR